MLCHLRPNFRATLPHGRETTIPLEAKTFLSEGPPTNSKYAVRKHSGEITVYGKEINTRKKEIHVEI